MDEASSKFVDQLAIEKLIAEKISTAHHRPSRIEPDLFVPAFAAMRAPIVREAAPPCSSAESIVHLRSPIGSGFPENDTIPVRIFDSTNGVSGIVLLVHGLYEDNRAMYGFFVRELNRLGYTVYLTTLPYHHERTPLSARFSGDLFLSADLSRTKQAFVQAVLDVRSVHTWIQAHASVPVYAVGFSMGGTVVLAAAGADETIRGAAVVNPAAVLSDVIWTSPLCATIKADLLNGGWVKETVDGVFDTFDPYRMPVSPEVSQKILCIYGLYDQITRRDQYEALIRKWRFPEVLEYKAGHLNTLKVPRFALDLGRFFDGLSHVVDAASVAGSIP